MNQSLAGMMELQESHIGKNRVSDMESVVFFPI